MKVIGITGGVGSGKSEVLSILEKDFNCGIIRTDDVARELCEPGGICLNKIIQNFGTDILTEDGRLDRPAMAKVVFDNSEKMTKLNNCIHPYVFEWVQNQVKQWKKEEKFRMIAVETALPESFEKMAVCESIWYVYVKQEIRRERLRISRGYSDEKMDAMFATQLPDEAYCRYCDAIIDNNSDIENIKNQLNALCK